MEKGLIAFIIVLVVGLVIYASVERSEVKIETLPVNATEIVKIGDGWCYFTLDNKRFLYHKSIVAHRGFECITQVRE